MAALSSPNFPVDLVAKMSSFVLQNTSKQDVALHGSTDEFDFVIVSDGHGQGQKKHTLRKLFNVLDWSAILQNKNWYKNDVDEDGEYISPLFAILHNSDAFSSLYSTRLGCTLSVVLIYPDKFECFTIGDSSIKIWEKKEEWSRIFVSVDHDIHFTEDVAKFEKRNVDDALFCRKDWLKEGVFIKNGINLEGVNRLKPIDCNTMTMEKSAYFYFDDNSKLNMTRALGHYPPTTTIQKAKDYNFELSCSEHSLTKVVIERKKVPYVVIGATDGVWDVAAEDIERTMVDLISKEADAEECVALVKNLWNQEWDYIQNGEINKTSMPDWSHDDIAMSVAYCSSSNA